MFKLITLAATGGALIYDFVSGIFKAPSTVITEAEVNKSTLDVMDIVYYAGLLAVGYFAYKKFMKA